jgi:hypothetical protein
MEFVPSLIHKTTMVTELKIARKVTKAGIHIAIPLFTAIHVDLVFVSCGYHEIPFFTVSSGLLL